MWMDWWIDCLHINVCNYYSVNSSSTYSNSTSCGNSNHIHTQEWKANLLKVCILYVMTGLYWFSASLTYADGEAGWPAWCFWWSLWTKELLLVKAMKVYFYSTFFTRFYITILYPVLYSIQHSKIRS